TTNKDRQAGQTDVVLLCFIENHVKVRRGIFMQQAKPIEHPRAAVMVGNHIQGQIRCSKATEYEHQYLDNIRITDYLHTSQRDENSEDGDAIHTDGEIDIRYSRYRQSAQ